MAKANATAKKMTLVERIIATVTGGDEGKVRKFFAKLVKVEETEVKKLNSNRKAAILKYDIEIEEMNDRIEDALDSVNDTYENVKADDLGSNSDIADFTKQYWASVVSTEGTLENLKETLAAMEEAHKENLEGIDEQIGKHQARIAKLNS